MTKLITVVDVVYDVKRNQMRLMLDDGKVVGIGQYEIEFYTLGDRITNQVKRLLKRKYDKEKVQFT